MGFLSSLSLWLLVTVALGAPPPKVVSKKNPSPGTGVSGTGNSGGGQGTTQLEKDAQVIQNILPKITNDPHGNLESWHGPNVCKYKGIICDKKLFGVDAITGVEIPEFGLSGPNFTPADFLLNLPYLQFLHARGNGFFSVPDDLSQLTRLEDLELADNHLAGAFPMGSLTPKKLFYLDLRFNKLAGPIPGAVFLTNANAIFLNDNLFTGGIPSEIGKSTASYVVLADNKLSGPIPSTLNDMPNIVEMQFRNNQLSGPLPNVDNLKDTTVMEFSQNQLTGSIHVSYPNLPGLEILNFTSNHLTGHLPEFSAKSLKYFEAANNEFEGEIPESLCALPKISGIDLRNNKLTGKLGPACMKIILDKKRWLDARGNCIENLQNQRPGCGLPGGTDGSDPTEAKRLSSEKMLET